MPGFDGTGPFGQGPLTGRGLGPCGRGFGWRRGFGRRFRWWPRFFGPAFWQFAPASGAVPKDEREYLEEERRYLEEELETLKQELAEINKRLKELK